MYDYQCYQCKKDLRAAGVQFFTRLQKEHTDNKQKIK